MKKMPTLLEIVFVCLISYWVWNIWGNIYLFDYINGDHYVRSMKHQLKHIQRYDVSEDDLRGYVTGMKLDFPTNTYHPEISYRDSSDWSVRLIPEKQRSYRIGLPWHKKILRLEFSKIDYPIIEIQKTIYSEAEDDN